jgi:hypothetical protein
MAKLDVKEFTASIARVFAAAFGEGEVDVWCCLMPIERQRVP